MKKKSILKVIRSKGVNFLPSLFTPSVHVPYTPSFITRPFSTELDTVQSEDQVEANEEDVFARDKDIKYLISQNDKLRTLLEPKPFHHYVVNIPKKLLKLVFVKPVHVLLGLSDFTLTKFHEFFSSPLIVTTWYTNTKKSIVKNVKHYVNGFKLLIFDIKTSSHILRKSVTSSSPISRRERKQLLRTLGDIFRIVPMSILIFIPFLEVLIPVIIKFYPNALPSQFISRDELNAKKKLKAKLELAKFLQETVIMMSNSKSNKEELIEFISKIRDKGDISTEEIAKFAKYFKDEVTLDHLERSQLVAMCKFMDLSAFASNSFLRFSIRSKLRKIKADDRLIYWEGVKSLSEKELVMACRDRGIKIGANKDLLRTELRDWLNLSLNYQIPPSLLILSRAFSFLEPQKKTEDVSVMIIDDEDIVIKPQVIQNVLNVLPNSLVDTMLTEDSNEEKLRSFKKEQELIKVEEEELAKIIKEEEEEENLNKLRKYLLEQIESEDEIVKKEREELNNLFKHFSSSVDEKNDGIMTENTKVKNFNKRMLKLLTEISGDIEELEEDISEDKKDILVDLVQKDDKIIMITDYDDVDSVTKEMISTDEIIEIIDGFSEFVPDESFKDVVHEEFAIPSDQISLKELKKEIKIKIDDFEVKKEATKHVEILEEKEYKNDTDI